MSGPTVNLAEIPSVLLQTLMEEVEVKMRFATLGNGFFAELPFNHVFNASEHHLRTGGQRIRAKLGLSASWSLGLTHNDAICLASCAELLHNASLVHDDLQDGDLVRRGEATIWAKFGKDIAICCGDHFLSASYSVLAGMSTTTALPDLISLVHQRISMAIYGQCADLAALNPKQNLLDQYLQISKAKSGALLGLPLELALVTAQHKTASLEAMAACQNFAVAYQILDDLQDLSTDSKRKEQAPDTVGVPVLNIIFILKEIDSHANSTLVAVDMALKHLALCEATVPRLPNGSGHLLLGYCAKMRIMLNDFYHFAEDI